MVMNRISLRLLLTSPVKLCHFVRPGTFVFSGPIFFVVGARSSVAVKALCYKPEGPGLHSR
jgi:hypothetical protein